MSKGLKIALIAAGAVGVVATGVVLGVKYLKKTNEGLLFDEDDFDFLPTSDAPKTINSAE